MKRFSYLIPLFTVLFVLLGLVACTGSTEESDSNFLFVVAYQDKVALVDAESLISEDLTVQQDSLFAPKDLIANSKAVAFDFSSRDNFFRGRDELFLLSRDDSNQAYVSFFDMTNANMDNEDGALVTKRDAFEVGVGLARAEGVSAPSRFCVTDIQASESGRYIVLVSNQRVCDNNTQEANAIDIIDLGSDLQDEPTLIYHKNLAQNVGQSSQIYLDQIANTLLFFEGAEGQGILRRLSLPDLEEETVLRNIDIENILDVQVQPSSDDESIIVARTSNYSVITNYLDSATIETVNDFDETVTQIFPSPSRFFALTDDTFFVYDTPELINNISTTINAKDAFYHPENYVYLLIDRNIQRYDVLGNFDVPDAVLKPFSVSALEDVQLFTWVREITSVITP